MTGFGKASSNVGDKQISIDIKSLNGKLTEVRSKIPAGYKNFELAIRKMVLEKAVRGKVELTLTINDQSSPDVYAINKKLFTSYYKDLKSLQDELNIPHTDIIQAVMRIPSVVDVLNESITDEEWHKTEHLINEALDHLIGFQQEEGQVLKEDIISRVETIVSLLDKVSPLEQYRIEKLRDRIARNLEGLVQIDQNRFEQEVLYYLEKLDISEEKIRLAQHCTFCLEVIEDAALEKGKKLGFIAQEMGREINTLGSKAQDSDIQQLVVMMKDELEKIKEQIANVI